MRLSKERGPRPNWGSVTGALFLLILGASFGPPARSQDLTADAWRLESRGEAGQASERLKGAAASASATPAVLRGWAEFLERQHDPTARQAYEKLAAALDRT